MASWCLLGPKCEHTMERPFFILAESNTWDIGRPNLLGSGSLGNSHADTQNRICTQLRLVLGSVKLLEKLVDFGLILHVDVLLHKGRGNRIVDIRNSLGDT